MTLPVQLADTEVKCTRCEISKKKVKKMNKNEGFSINAVVADHLLTVLILASVLVLAQLLLFGSVELGLTLVVIFIAAVGNYRHFVLYGP